MFKDLTQGEKTALLRVSTGSEIDSEMWEDLSQKGLVESRKGARVITEAGKARLAQI